MILRKLIYFVCIGLFVTGCDTSDPDVTNPYDNQAVGQEHDKVDGEKADLDPNTIEGIHANIFVPTCANSGCHDGNFEPDFRTIESSYNTLVEQPIIKQDEMNPLTARVTPGTAATSMIIRRLQVDLNGNSGLMPILVDPESDWPTKKDEYIKNIETWINNGALNQNGKVPTASNYPVQLRGIVAKVNGSLVSRSGTYKSINIPSGASAVEVWVSFVDDGLTADQLTNAAIDLSISANSFDSTNLTTLTYAATPLVVKGYFGDDESFYHKATIDVSSWPNGAVIWVRTHVSDGVNTSEAPNSNSLFRAKEYATLKLK
ncbi:MAG: hypothetical protein ACI9JN_002373 [Bacteroidia bacterium]|jgi:hypothetical protein